MAALEILDGTWVLYKGVHRAWGLEAQHLLWIAARVGEPITGKVCEAPSANV